MRPELTCVLMTLQQLARYYARHEHRVELHEVWRDKMVKWDKLKRSLAVWLPKMAVGQLSQQAAFLADVLLFLHACWAEQGVARAAQHAGAGCPPRNKRRRNTSQPPLARPPQPTAADA